MFAEFTYQDQHQEHSSPDDPDTNVEPVEHGDLSGLFAAEHVINRLGFRLEGKFKTFDCEDASMASGVVFDQDNRDRSEYELSLRSAYELAPEYGGFIRAAYNLRNNEDSADCSTRIKKHSARAGLKVCPAG